MASTTMMMQQQSRTMTARAAGASSSASRPAPTCLPLAPAPQRQHVFGAASTSSCLPALPARTHRRRVCRVASGDAEVKAQVQEQADDLFDWVPVCLPEELPKGVRKEVEVDGASVLLFWYRNQIYCTQARSPAEGAYSEGLIKAKFTQDFCIECPSTGSLFSLKDGSIVAWYPNNPVLAALTPRDLCKPLEIYPVKLTQQAILVDVTRAASARTAPQGRGGAGTSIDNNNVFTVQPTVYFEGMDPSREQASLYMDQIKKKEKLDPAVAIATTAGVGAFAVAGTAVCIYLENVLLLAVFWAVLGGAAAYVAYQYVTKTQSATGSQ